MNGVNLKKHSRYYVSMCSIPNKKYLQKTHYFEQHEIKILQLDNEEKYVILLQYIDALFKLGVYDKFLNYIDEVLIYSLDNNLEEDQMIYFKQLMRKGIALFKQEKYKYAIHIFEEVLKMENDNKEAQAYMQRSNKELLKNEGIKFKNILITSISILVLTYFIKSIFLNPFYPEKTYIANGIVIVSSAVSLFILIHAEYRIAKKAKKYVKNYLTMLQDKDS